MKYALFFLVFPLILPFCRCGRGTAPPHLPAVAASFAVAGSTPVAIAATREADVYYCFAAFLAGFPPTVSRWRRRLSPRPITPRPRSCRAYRCPKPPTIRHEDATAPSAYLDFLTKTTPAPYDKVIGLTESDISTTKGEYDDWGIFGLGNLSGRACVVSDYRPAGGTSPPRSSGRVTPTSSSTKSGTPWAATTARPQGA